MSSIITDGSRILYDTVWSFQLSKIIVFPGNGTCFDEIYDGSKNPRVQDYEECVRRDIDDSEWKNIFFVNSRLVFTSWYYEYDSESLLNNGTWFSNQTCLTKFVFLFWWKEFSIVYEIT